MEILHGTRKGYSDGCRCAPCRAAWATYIRTRRQKSGQQTPRAEHLINREIASAEALAQRTAAAEDEDGSLSVPLTPLGLQILANLQRHQQKRRGEVIDQLLREFGADLLGSAA